MNAVNVSALIEPDLNGDLALQFPIPLIGCELFPSNIAIQFGRNLGAFYGKNAKLCSSIHVAKGTQASMQNFIEILKKPGQISPRLVLCTLTMLPAAVNLAGSEVVTSARAFQLRIDAV